VSHLFGLTFFMDGKEHTATEMRAEDQPMAQARAYVKDLQKEGIPGAVLVARFLQTGMHLELQTMQEVTNLLGEQDSATKHLMKLEVQKTLQRHGHPRTQPKAAASPRKKRPPTVFMTQKDGGVKSVSRGKPRVFLGPAIEFGTGKNKRMVPLEAAQRMAAQLESASRASGRRKPPRPKTVAGALDQVKKRSEVRPCRPKFQTGIIEVSELAQRIASHREVMGALKRFEACDWGDVSRTVTVANNKTTRKRLGILRGRYPVRQGLIFVKTTMTRSGNALTTVTLPEEGIS
jgi:hypothetical protein